MFEFFINRFKFKPKFDSAYQSAKISYLRRIRISVTLFYFAMGLCFASWASRIPDIKTTLHLSDAALGTLLFAVPVGQLALMPFSGKLVTRHGSKKMLLISMLLYAASLLALGISYKVWHLAAGLFAFGMFGNLANIAVNTQGVDAEALFHKAIMSSFHGAWSFAGFIGALIGFAMLALKLSTVVHFICISVITLLIIIFAGQFLVKAKEKVKQESRRFFSRPDPLLLWLGVIGFCCMASEGVMFDWSGVYFNDIVKAPGALVILGYTTFMIMMAAGRFSADHLIRKYGRKPMLKISGVMISLGLFTAVIFPYLIPSTIAFMIVGLGVASVVPIIYSIAGKHPDVPPGEALTIVSSVSFLGFLAGPPLIGYIAEVYSLRVSFAIIGIFGFVISFMAARIATIEKFTKH